MRMINVPVKLKFCIRYFVENWKKNLKAITVSSPSVASSLVSDASQSCLLI